MLKLISATYLRCCDCGTETTQFVTATAEEGFFLATLQCVVVLGAFDKQAILRWPRRLRSGRMKKQKYEPDDGPLTRAQLAHVKKAAKEQRPKGKLVSSRSLLKEVGSQAEGAQAFPTTGLAKYIADLARVISRPYGAIWIAA